MSFGPIRARLCRCAEVDLVFPTARPRTDAEPNQAIAALLEYQEVSEQLESLLEHVGAVGDHFLPVFDPRRLDRRLHQSIVRCVEVGPDVEVAAEVIGRVLQARPSRLEDGEGPFGLVGIAEPEFGAERLSARYHQVAVGLRPSDPAREGLVRSS
jgi:hypothetical protein